MLFMCTLGGKCNGLHVCHPCERPILRSQLLALMTSGDLGSKLAGWKIYLFLSVSHQRPGAAVKTAVRLPAFCFGVPEFKFQHCLKLQLLDSTCPLMQQAIAQMCVPLPLLGGTWSESRAPSPGCGRPWRANSLAQISLSLSMPLAFK